jgi:hypothetical protein
MKKILILIVFAISAAGMAAAQVPANPHNPHDVHSIHQQAHQQAHQHAMETHRQHHELAMEMHRQAHEQAVRHANCCNGTDPNCIHQWHELKPRNQESGLFERIRQWREQRRAERAEEPKTE